MSLESLEDRSAIFFDRDGTLIVDKVYQKDPAQTEYQVGYFELITFLQRAQKFLLFVVTNQSGIGRGFFKESNVMAIHDRMNQDLVAKGLRPFQGIKLCPHRNEDQCQCRKPMPGMILELLHEWKIDPTKSYMVGDKLSDVEAGRAAGLAQNILISETSQINLTSVPNLLKLVEYFQAL
ncbi:MAG: HAD family hydrolase [Bacteriovoracaceae bacterium]|nr:HAD family hydrolase [Bacteriovoracaceae bacterium]